MSDEVVMDDVDVQEGNPEEEGPQGYALEDIKLWLEQMELSTEGTEEEIRARWAEALSAPTQDDKETLVFTPEECPEEELYPQILFEFEEKWGTHFVRAIGDLPVFKGKLYTGPNIYLDVYGLQLTEQQFYDITGEKPEF